MTFWKALHLLFFIYRDRIWPRDQGLRGFIRGGSSLYSPIKLGGCKSCGSRDQFILIFRTKKIILLFPCYLVKKIFPLKWLEKFYFVLLICIPKALIRLFITFLVLFTGQSTLINWKANCTHSLKKCFIKAFIAL